MSLLDRFKRDRQKSVLPDEVKQYYQSEQRQRSGVAIGVALIALLITLAIAAGLFFGGKFVYNKIRGDDKKPDSSQTSNNDHEDSDESEESPRSPQPEASEPTRLPSSPETPTPAPAPAPRTTPSLGDTPSMPRTGDEGM